MQIVCRTLNSGDLLRLLPRIQIETNQINIHSAKQFLKTNYGSKMHRRSLHFQKKL